MAAQNSLHVALTGPLLTFIAEQVATGRYASASEVVRSALRLLIEQDETKLKQRSMAQLETRP